MYTTTDVESGWNGYLNGEPAQEGAYGYFITIQDGSGRIFERQGMMTLLVSD
jgi:hypothetical protein